MEPNEIVRQLRELLPPKVDYAALVCAEGFAHGQHYVWDSPEPYAMKSAADCIERLQAEMEERERNHRISVNAGAYTIKRLQAELEASQRQLRAAVEDLSQDAHCTLCKHHRSEGGNCIGVSMCAVKGRRVGWQWRGPREANEHDT